MDLQPPIGREALNSAYVIDILNQARDVLYLHASGTNGNESRDPVASTPLTAHAAVDAVLDGIPGNLSIRQSVLRALQTTAVLDDSRLLWEIDEQDLGRTFDSTMARLRNRHDFKAAQTPLAPSKDHIRIVQIPERTVHGASCRVDCLFTITVDLAERANGNPIRLASHVYKHISQPAIWDGPRSRPVDPKPWAHRLTLPVVIPNDSGAYFVTLLPVVEDTFWGEHSTDPYARLWVERHADGSLTVVDYAAQWSTRVFDVPDRDGRVVLPPFVDLRGSTLFLDPRDQMVSPAIALGAYEPFELRLVEWLIPAGGTIIDVGAHIGYYTIQVAALAGRNGRVEAFEPDPRNVDLLQRSVRVNGFEAVRVHPAAVGETEGQSLLYRSSFANTGDHRIYDTGEGRETIVVPVVSLDGEFAGRLNRLDLLKIDVQGAEASVLRGAQHLLTEQPDAAILTEFWPFGLKQSAGSARETLALLRSANRQLLMVDEEHHKLREIPDEALLMLEGRDTYVNLLAVPPSLLIRIPPEWVGEPASVGQVC